MGRVAYLWMTLTVLALRTSANKPWKVGAMASDLAGKNATATATGKYRLMFTKSYGDDHVCLTELEFYGDGQARLNTTFVSMSSCYGCTSCTGCEHRYGDPTKLFDGDATSDDPSAWTCTAPGTFVEGVGSQSVVFQLSAKPTSYSLKKPTVNGQWVNRDFSLEEEMSDGTWQIIDNVVDAEKTPDQTRTLTMAPVSLSPPIHVHVAWSYANTDAWVEDYPTCGGRQQSPIDLELMKDMDSRGDTKLPYTYSPMAGRALANTGSTLQVGGKFGTLSLSGGEYAAINFHFHFPPEHRIGGEEHLAIGEMQIVHQKVGAREGSPDDLAIVSIMLHLPLEHDELTAGEKFFIDLGMLAIPPANNYSQPLSKPVDLNVFKSQLAGNFWQYTGSLATPPCTEGVEWFVMEKPAFISGVVVDHFKQVFSEPQNSRPLQQGNGRVVSLNALPGAAAAASL